MKRPRRKEVFKQGKRGRLVRVVEGTHRGVPVFTIEYRKADGLRTATHYPRTRAGKAKAIGFAEGVVQKQSEPAVPAAPRRRTVTEIFDLFAAEKFPTYRPASIRMARFAWNAWANFVGPSTIAEDVGRQSMIGLRTELETRGWAVTTMRQTFGWIRQVYTHAILAEWIDKNKVSSYVYRVGKDQRPVSPAEFRSDDFDALLDALPLDDGRYWRARTVLGVCGHQGARQWSVLHLQWPDVDPAAGAIIWRAAWDKMGNEWRQPLRAPTRALLEVAWQWRLDCGYEGPWVFWPANRRNRTDVYTRGALWRALVAAEKRAKIPHLPGRGAHGLRRLLAGEVHALTGSVKDAMDAIGDKDIKQAMRYLKPRDDRMRQTFGTLDARRSGPIPAEPEERK